MNKEDILEKSRSSNRDEGMEHAESKGFKIGYIAFSVMFSILAVLCFFFWQIGTFHAISSLFWIYFSAESYVKFRFTKKLTYLVAFICGGIASVGALIQFIFILIG